MTSPEKTIWTAPKDFVWVWEDLTIEELRLAATFDRQPLREYLNYDN